MSDDATSGQPRQPRPERLSRAARRRQLLGVALEVVRAEGADRLTLGRLAEQAKVSKPVVYDHFGTRAGLLIDLYKMLDSAQNQALREALDAVEHDASQSVRLLARAYIHCSVDTGGEYQAIGAALAGSPEMAAVHQELLRGYVDLFVRAMRAHCDAPAGVLRLRCVGLVGAGEALSAAMLRGDCTEAEAAETLARLMIGALGTPV